MLKPWSKKMTFIIQKLFPFYIIDKHLPENTVTKANRQWKKFWLRKFFLFKHWSTQPYMTTTRFDTPVQVLIKTAPAGDLGTLMQVLLTIISLATILVYDKKQAVDLYISDIYTSVINQWKLKLRLLYIICIFIFFLII